MKKLLYSARKISSDNNEQRKEDFKRNLERYIIDGLLNAVLQELHLMSLNLKERDALCCAWMLVFESGNLLPPEQRR